MADKAAGAPLVALVVGPQGAYAVGPGIDESWPLAEVGRRFVAAASRLGPRWVLWSAASTLREVVGAGIDVARTWDLAETHRLLHGGWAASPGHVLAACRGLDEAAVPLPRTQRLSGFDGDLFDLADAGDRPLLTAEGHLRADALSRALDQRQLRELAVLALECQAAQLAALGRIGGGHLARLERTVWSESAAAVLCLELERDGLPVDRLAAEDLIAASAGPRARDEADAARIRSERDRAVLRHAPGRERTDLRNPTQVRELLASVGVDVPNTRAWMLEPYRVTHPLVDALLRWRKDERIATTYGYRWLDEHVGPDDRLRGGWTACDGAAGRMTAQNGLHNLPAPLRPAIAAAPGHVFVRADLGQIEPRVLAVVSGDRAFAEATRSDDLYAPVAAKLGADRPIAKIAVLAAMYGQRSGAAGEALKDLERAYPVAMGLLDRAYDDGVARRSVRTWGGRLIRFGEGPPRQGEGAEAPGGSTTLTDASAGADASRGRYARNAIIQGSAAELFKAWAATVRHAVRPLGGQIVLCLHDELIVHVPEQQAAAAAEAVEAALTGAARTWAGTDQVRFVADTSIIRRWSDAKP
ncbi:DNA polymerase [Humibacillus xanthopallidus]|uniref:DNA-directed DNA polymerase n=1 Tax=Humibacillus xanthopallidus TaxID=412689 RepID=A0A543HJE5_9MICO|nr:DNA polymerase [Humibacillus xanthopallidus]TQM58462.1 DNA polymerase-1 [Humibacillus xanthopallidus]